MADQQILEAPTEVLVLTLAFTLISFGVIAVMARMAFHPDTWIARAIDQGPAERERPPAERPAPPQLIHSDTSPARAQQLSMAVGESLRREERILGAGGSRAGMNTYTSSTTSASADAATPTGRAVDALGTSYRRATRRVSAAGQRRDRTP